jgi:hypothetical protein
MSYKSSTKILGEKRQLSNREISPVKNKKIYVENPEENCIVKKGKKLYINSSKNEIEINSIILSLRNGMIYKGIDHQRKRYAIKISAFQEDSPDSLTIDIISKLEPSKKLHFVNYYTYFTCNRVKEIISDNVILASTKNIAFEEKHIISIMDLYNYRNNLIINMSDSDFNHNHKKNIFTQFIISILSFHIFTKRLHLDVQIGNFFIEVLSKSGKITEPKHNSKSYEQHQTRHPHKYRQLQQSIKPIEYISYIIYGNLIHLENIDLNVIIGDYEFSIDYNDNINAVNNYREDYHTIINMGIENNFFYILKEHKREEIKNVNSFKGNEKDYIELLRQYTDIFAHKKNATDKNSTKPFFIS